VKADVPAPALAWLRLARSWICVDDEAIFTDWRVCPACGGAQIMPISRWLGTVQERAER